MERIAKYFNLISNLLHCMYESCGGVISILYIILRYERYTRNVMLRNNLFLPGKWKFQAQRSANKIDS